jgi:hypothetical protein
LKFKIAFTAVILLFLASVRPAFAIYDPLSVPNNRVGIHIFSEKDLSDAANLVNSEGGDWGYVTFVITEAERDRGRWQNVFDEMRRHHLIPIVRVATKAVGPVWEKPKTEEINNWVGFLNSLNWVVQNRYVVVLNEPNHAGEWGGSINPAEYASYLKEFSEKLKSASGDFFVLPAGLDPATKEDAFIQGMIKAEPGIFDSIDGWTSHSYPSVAISEYKREIAFIKSLGVSKDLPVFITETGWSNKRLSPKDIGKNLTMAYQNEWNDPAVVAVTPFILDYNQEPFAEFSWREPGGNFYSYYEDVRKIKKTQGRPLQAFSGQILLALSQPVVIPGSDLFGAIWARNTGQSIWSLNNLAIKSEGSGLLIKSYFLNSIEPFNNGLIIFKALSPDRVGLYYQSIYLSEQNGKRITNSFPIEGALIRVDEMQLRALFAKMLGYLNF